MDGVVVVLGVIFGCAIVGRMLGTYVSRGYNAYAALIHGRDDGTFYAAALPWPIGVQEEDEVHWHIPATVSPPTPDATIEDLPTPPPEAGYPRPPTRPQPRTWRGH